MQWHCKWSVIKNHRNCWEPPRNATYSENFNSYSFNFNGRSCNRRTGFCQCRTPCPGGEQFFDFWSVTSCDFTAFYSFFTQANICFLRCALLVPWLICVQIIMVHFDAWILASVALKKRCSFWRSVYDLQLFASCSVRWMSLIDSFHTCTVHIHHTCTHKHAYMCKHCQSRTPVNNVGYTSMTWYTQAIEDFVYLNGGHTICMWQS